ncbi:helix-turn-helix transcriptional regulator [Actinoplanes sp. NPDC051633]|uniref:helix-turn-helix domain-containing protein n=1 Tax=Actinoplanes sp. NPDC051633 TaxID=3155670 RepID=UPI0034194F53
MPSVTPLAKQLKALRTGAGLTQLALSKALGVSVPLISSWEKDTIPPDSRLDEIARVFSADWTGKPQLKDVDDLGPAEQAAYEGLRTELFDLRQPEPAGPPIVQNPLKFGAGEAITIVCSKATDSKRLEIGDVELDDANYIDSYKYGDLDALIELLPAVVALNPISPIAVGTADELSAADLNDHLIALGGVDLNSVTAALMAYFDHVPVKQHHRRNADDIGSFDVGLPNGKRRVLRPKVSREGERTILREDVAHFLRAPNPYNRRRTLTIFNGMFSRGSYGVVRALTDPKIRERNAAYAAERLNSADTYSLVCRVRIIAKEVVVPDWTVAEDRLHEWPEEVA